MLKKIEIFAERVVDYLEKKNKKAKHKQKPTKLIEENIQRIYYKIIPYHKNESGPKEFLKLLNNFSFYSQRINFYLVGNNLSSSIIVGFPENLKDKFKTYFYNYFPSSKLQKIDFQEPKLDKFIGVSIDDYIKLSKSSEKNFFNETFFLFKDIPSSSTGVIRYSLVINSSSNVAEYETLLELIWKGIKLFFYGLYYFFYRVFFGEKPKIKRTNKKQKLETGIEGTAISIGIGGYNTIKSFYNYLNSNTDFDLFIQDEEIFSPTKLSYFSKIFYIPTTKISGLEYINYKRLPPPSNLPSINDDITSIGYADWADEKQIVGIKQEDKLRHVYIIGKTGVGKSTLLSNMILSDIEQNRGLALIDPHGDLVNTILSTIPENRKDDLVLFDVSDTEHVPGFNVFQQEKDENIDLSVSTTLSIFKKLYGHSWGPRLEYIFRNVLFALSEYKDANFLHILKMLTDKQFRKKVLTYVKDPVIKDFWEKEFAKRSERFSSEAISPIMNKVGQFVSSSIVRNIFGQQKSTISISDVMNNNKILLVNLSKGLIGEDNSTMIGSFIVSQIQLETMKRANLPLEERKNFTLYIDEFQNFVTESFSTILSEARKYNLSLVVANQYISQIDPKVQSSIFGNVGNLICFNSGNEDAKILSDQFKNQITINDILSIPKFKAYTKIMIDGTSTDVFGINILPIDKNKIKSKNYVEQIKELSNKKYTVEKEKIVSDLKNMISESTISTNIDNNKTNTIKTVNNGVIGDIFEGKVKLKFNYGLFVEAGGYEGLLHKKNIHLPEGINWKDYFSIGDTIQVKMLELKDIDGQKKAVWEYR